MKKIVFNFLFASVCCCSLLLTSCTSLSKSEKYKDFFEMFDDAADKDSNPILNEEGTLDFENLKIMLESEEMSDSTSKALDKTLTSLEKSLEQITPEMEYYIGRSVAANVLTMYTVLDNPKVTEYVNKICSAITINSPKPYLFKGYSVVILDTDELNAMATPGGHIFITKGLLKCTNSEDAIAAVIAHEISHIQLGHSIKSIKSNRIKDTVMDSLATIATIASQEAEDSKFIEITEEDINSLREVTGSIAGTLLNSGFSVAQELTADKYALSLLAGAGYDPTAMIDMLKMLNSEMNTTDESSGWGKTHPKPRTRIKNVKENLRKNTFKFSKRSHRQNRYEDYMADFN